MEKALLQLNLRLNWPLSAGPGQPGEYRQPGDGPQAVLNDMIDTLLLEQGAAAYGFVVDDAIAAESD